MRVSDSRCKGARINHFASALYWVLVRAEHLRSFRALAWLGNRLLASMQKWFSQETIRTQIHGKPVIANFGFTYPLYMRRFPGLNAPLLELVHQASRALARPVSVIDVGAAIGDTALLVESNLGNAVDSMLCVEGDEQFFSYLQQNLSQLPGSFKACKALLSSARESITSLKRIHAGTASAQGTDYDSAVPLDDVVRDANFSVDVLKVDVDGFDGRVLMGSQRLLSTMRPAVIFEWHPALYQQTGNSVFTPFQLLHSLGYSIFIWYTKYGDWVFTQSEPDAGTISAMSAVCTGPAFPDWHYDIVALHADSPIRPPDLVTLDFAKRRRSRY